LSTGGFSVTDNSIATYDSAAIDYALWPVMILGSIAFPVHYLILRGDLRNFYADLQTRWVFGSFALGSTAVVGILTVSGTYDSVSAAVRYGGFQFISAMSCTGFQSAPAGDWPATAQLTLAMGMTVGAAAGSTVGGIKLVRLLTLVKGTAFRIRGVFYPASAVRRFRFDGRKLSDTEAAQEFEEAAIVAFLWVVFLILGAFVLLTVVPESYTLENVVFEIASTQGNVGLSTGITGPDMSPIAKVTFLFNMWIGRLEIIPVLVALRAVLTREGN
ncbi:MAG: TrkH family potassium uptake protein, partial [Halobacteriaceae archaeon]